MIGGGSGSPGTGRAGTNVSPDRAPFLRKRRILWSLLAVLCFVGLAPLGTVAWKLIEINREALKTSQQELQLLMASTVAREVDLQIEALRSQMAAAAREVGGLVGRSRTVAPETVRRVLGDVADDRLLYLRYADLHDGIVDTRSTATLPPDLEPIFVTAIRGAVESIPDGRAGGAPGAAVSAPILLAGSPPRAAVVMSMPVVAGGTFRGVLSALVDLQAVWDAIVRGNRTGHTILAVDAKGRPFATSEREGVRFAADISRSEIVKRFLDGPRRARETLPFSLATGGRNETYLGSYEITREGWGIVVHAKERQIYLPVGSMVRRTLFWAAGALGLAVIVAIAFAGTLSKPIDHLAAAAQAFAGGDLSHRVEVRSRNEIGELADAFNRMASRIEDSIQRLKEAADENNLLFLGTARALAQAIDAKDPYTRGHSVRVNRYAVVIAKELQLSREDIQNIHVASLLHDVGKIGIDDAILKKPARLTAEEFSAMKTHPVLGATIMAPIRQMKKIIPGLRSHHERWTGGGYPDGLVGEAIPLMARIIAAADTFDAMTTDRPYQRASTFEEALAKLNALKGKVLDDRIVEAFNRAYQAGDFRPGERETHELAAATA